MSDNPMEDARNQPADAWGENGPNQAINEQEDKTHIKNYLWQKRPKTTRARELDQGKSTSQ
jgi:hypothetical protein